MNKLTKFEIALLLLASQTGSIFAHGRRNGRSGLAAMSSGKRPRHADPGKKMPQKERDLPKAS